VKTDDCNEEELNGLQWASLEYYIREFNYRNGLIADKTQAGAPASIAAVGMAMATLPILAAREHLPRRLLARRLLSRLRFLWQSPHGPETDAITVACPVWEGAVGVSRQWAWPPNS
jgi:hypothetical protein